MILLFKHFCFSKGQILISSPYLYQIIISSNAPFIPFNPDDSFDPHDPSPYDAYPYDPYDPYASIPPACIMYDPNYRYNGKSLVFMLDSKKSLDIKVSEVKYIFLCFVCVMYLIYIPHTLNLTNVQILDWVCAYSSKCIFNS